MKVWQGKNAGAAAILRAFTDGIRRRAPTAE
jgi:hypothetical protein